MTSSELDYALKDYAAALDVLETSAPELTAEHVLHVLLARDGVEAVLINQKSSAAPSLVKLVELDKRLKAKADLVNQAINLSECNPSFGRRPEAWWWALKPSDRVDPWDRYDWLWSGLSLPLLTAAFSLVTDISTRFLSSGPDTLGAFAVTTQSVITLLAAGGALTKGGQGAIENILASLNIPRRFRQETKLGMSMMLLLGLIAFRSSLPRIAEQYVDEGIQDWSAGRWTQAMQEYNRALDLDPTNARVHYYLGALYEDMQDFDRARSEYRIATQGGNDQAYNNLARLYILNKKPETAVPLLLKRLEFEENVDFISLLQEANLSNPDQLKSRFQVKTIDGIKKVLEQATNRYYLRKNLGWARLEQKRFAEAQASLQEALDLLQALKTFQQKLDAQSGRPELETLKAPLQTLLDSTNNGASAHCLLAQAIEGQGDRKEALTEWNNCLNYAVPWNPDEDNWLHLARQRISAQENP